MSSGEGSIDERSGCAEIESGTTPLGKASSSQRVTFAWLSAPREALSGFSVVLEWEPRRTPREQSALIEEGTPLHRKLNILLSPAQLSLASPQLVQIARGVEYLHTRDPPVFHGDLKPKNILIDENWEACVGDFGVARAIKSLELHSGWTTSGVNPGTKLYQSPELLFENETTLAGDVYSFGCLMLTVGLTRDPKVPELTGCARRS